MDSNFNLIQSISAVHEDNPLWTVLVAPSRHGFLIHDGYPQYRIGYFEGNPVTRTLAADSCQIFAVTDGGFACGQNVVDSVQLTIHEGERERKLDNPLLRQAALFALPTPETLLVMTNKFQLFTVRSPTREEKVADLRWLAPGWNSGFRYELASGAGQRILFFSHGARFPISDTDGLGKYLRIAVLDISAKKIILRKQYAIDSDVAISPDGHLLAVREKNHLTLKVLP